MHYEHTSVHQHIQEVVREEFEVPLRQMLGEYLEALLQQEVAKYLQAANDALSRGDHQLAVRNGRSRERSVATSLGVVSVRQPRVHDRRAGHQFRSSILPPYLRRTPEVDSSVAALYLLGISSNQMGEAIAQLLGGSVALSAATVSGIIEQHSRSLVGWQQRSLAEKQYVYWWCDGIYTPLRLSNDRPCLLVIVGVLPDGTKELVAVHQGVRESKQSWLECLRDLRARGLQHDPKLVIGDGALGLWSALGEAMPSADQQRCTVHKTMNVLNAIPKKLHPMIKGHLHRIFDAPQKQQAEREIQNFQKAYADAYPKAWECLRKDQQELLRFYDYPPMHWKSIRSSNVIESAFSTIRHRTRQTKGAATADRAVAMLVALGRRAEQYWRKLDGAEKLPMVADGTYKHPQVLLPDS